MIRLSRRGLGLLILTQATSSSSSIVAQEEHAKAILAWAIRGTRDWYAKLVRNTYDPTKPSTGLVVPEVVRLATDQYQQDKRRSIRTG